jgi:hypothetical protein
MFGTSTRWSLLQGFGTFLSSALVSPQRTASSICDSLEGGIFLKLNVVNITFYADERIEADLYYRYHTCRDVACNVRLHWLWLLQIVFS